VAYLVDCAAGINGAALKFLPNRLQDIDTVRYFGKSRSGLRLTNNLFTGGYAEYGYTHWEALRTKRGKIVPSGNA